MDSQEFELEVGETLRIGPHVVTILDLDLESIALRLELPKVARSKWMSPATANGACPDRSGSLNPRHAETGYLQDGQSSGIDVISIRSSSGGGVEESMIRTAAGGVGGAGFAGATARGATGAIGAMGGAGRAAGPFAGADFAVGIRRKKSGISVGRAPPAGVGSISAMSGSSAATGMLAAGAGAGAGAGTGFGAGAGAGIGLGAAGQVLPDGSAVQGERSAPEPASPRAWGVLRPARELEPGPDAAEA